MEVLLIKTLNGLIPGDEDTEEWYKKLKLGAGVRADFAVMRNIKFHRKLFALLNLAFDYWEPGEIDTKFGVPQKNRDNFRKNLTILAGYGYPVFNVDGSWKMEAESISFAKMDNVKFERLYNSILNVILLQIPLLKKLGKDEVNKLVDQVLAFG